MDHHCYWLGNCVGLYNTQYFFQYGFYVLILNAVVAPNFLYFIFSHWNDFKFVDHIYMCVTMVIIFYTSYLGMTLTLGLSTLHIRNGFTMIEAKFMVMSPGQSLGGNAGVV